MSAFNTKILLKFVFFIFRTWQSRGRLADTNKMNKAAQQLLAKLKERAGAGSDKKKKVAFNDNVTVFPIPARSSTQPINSRHLLVPSGAEYRAGKVKTSASPPSPSSSESTSKGTGAWKAFSMAATIFF